MWATHTNGKKASQALVFVRVPPTTTHKTQRNRVQRWSLLRSCLYFLRSLFHRTLDTKFERRNYCYLFIAKMPAVQIRLANENTNTHTHLQAHEYKLSLSPSVHKIDFFSFRSMWWCLFVPIRFYSLFWLVCLFFCVRSVFRVISLANHRHVLCLWAAFVHRKCGYTHFLLSRAIISQIQIYQTPTFARATQRRHTNIHILMICELAFGLSLSTEAQTQYAGNEFASNIICAHVQLKSIPSHVRKHKFTCTCWWFVWLVREGWTMCSDKCTIIRTTIAWDPQPIRIKFAWLNCIQSAPSAEQLATAFKTHSPHTQI